MDKKLLATVFSIVAVVAILASVFMVFQTRPQQTVDSGSVAIPTEETTNTAPTAPSLHVAPTTEVYADDKVVELSDKMDQGQKDSWFLQQLEENGMKMKESTALKLRNDVCDNVDPLGVTIESLSLILDDSEYHFNDKEKGQFIAWSLSSKCPDGRVIIPFVG